MPTSKKKTFFISDLHLSENEPQIAALFLKLLKNCHPAQVEKLYILGDLFEFWIGDDDLTPFHLEIIRALKTVTQQGVPVYFLPGNRDFLIGEQFMQQTGCQFVADEEKISLYNTPVLIMHGDTLCTLDIRYQRWRKFLHSRLFLTTFLCLPLIIRKWIAKFFREKSSKHAQSLSMSIMDVNPSAVETTMQYHDVRFLIHGHTHRPAMHPFLINEHSVERIVLGAWHEDASILIWNETGEKKLVRLNAKALDEYFC